MCGRRERGVHVFCLRAEFTKCLVFGSIVCCPGECLFLFIAMCWRDLLPPASLLLLSIHQDVDDNWSFEVEAALLLIEERLVFFVLIANLSICKQNAKTN